MGGLGAQPPGPRTPTHLRSYAAAEPPAAAHSAE